MGVVGIDLENGTIGGLDVRDALVLIAIALCVLNILLVSVLAATGTLRTTQQGDIETTRTTTIPSGTVELPAGQEFVIETPTDADVFYNVVVLVQHGGPLYTDVGHDPFVQLIFNYFPIVYYLFPPIVAVGYVPYKFIWLLLGLVATIGGTAFLLRAETHHSTTSLSRRALWGLSLISIGFQPMVANFKVGQTTPLMYFFVGLFWYLFRRRQPWKGGAALVGAALFKPYVAAPLVIFSRFDRWRGIAGFVTTYVFANLLSVLTWGLNTTMEYYWKLLRFLLDEGEPALYDSFSDWSASHLRMFYWFGQYAPIVRTVILIPATIIFVRSILEYDEDPVPVFSLALLVIVLGLKTTTAIDLGILLGVVVVLGFRFYTEHDYYWPLAVLIFAFAGLQAHGYVLELLVGWGAQNIAIVSSNESLIITLLPILQPGWYSVFLLYALSLFAWASRHPDRRYITLG